jgi:hypothetical protein
MFELGREARGLTVRVAEDSLLAQQDSPIYSEINLVDTKGSVF